MLCRSLFVFSRVGVTQSLVLYVCFSGVRVTQSLVLCFVDRCLCLVGLVLLNL
jgi:hypothetical protein